VPIEAVQTVEPRPQEIVPQEPPPPALAEVAFAPLPPPPVTSPVHGNQPPHVTKVVATDKPRVMKATARVTPPPFPLPQGEGEMSASTSSQEAVSSAVSADALAAWQRALIAWLDSHSAYPEAARRVGEQGAVGVRFALSESGDVTEADIQHGSGSTTLDAATLAMLRGAHLPPPPPGTDAARRTISVSIRYRLN